MSRTVRWGRQTRMWMVGVGVLAFLSLGGGIALADAGGSGKATAADAPSAGKATAAVALSKSAKPGKKPGPTPTPTASPTASPTPVPSTSPSSGTVLPIPVSGFNSPNILVDQAHGHVYLTGGTGTNDLVVTDLDGGNLHVLAGIAPGAAGMALSPDDTKLYIAASGADWLRIVDTTTFALDGQFAGKTDGTLSCPRSLAFAAGQLWVAWGCGGADAGIGRVDLQTGAFTLNAIGAFDWRFSGLAPLLATVPSQPDMVIAAETDSEPAHVVRFQATSTVLNQQALRAGDGGAVGQLAITPDGSQVIVPSGFPYYHPAWRTSDLTEVHQYPTAAYPNAVAIRDDGLVIAGVDAEYDNDIYVFEPGGSTPIATYDFGRLPNKDTGDYELVTGGLAVSGNRIYAVVKSSDPSDTSRTLRILTLP